MYSKRIVISVIVIGCLVHFITCTSIPNGKKPNSNNQIKSPRKAATQNSNNSEGKQSTNYAASKPRALLSNDNANSRGNDNAKKPVNPAGNSMKPTAADKKKEIAEYPADNPEDNEELAKEKPIGRVRRTIRRLNNIRKKYCPFRFLRSAYKKGLGLIKPKPTEEEEPPEP
ncbi:hypothetical protein QTP88_022456 [Uroleucon formosanum]